MRAIRKAFRSSTRSAKSSIYSLNKWGGPPTGLASVTTRFRGGEEDIDLSPAFYLAD